MDTSISKNDGGNVVPRVDFSENATILRPAHWSQGQETCMLASRKMKMKVLSSVR